MAITWSSTQNTRRTSTVGRRALLIDSHSLTHSKSNLRGPSKKKSGVIGSETEILNTRPETLEPETSCTPQSPQHTKPFVHQKLYYAEPKHLAPETLQTWKPPSD